MLSNSRQGWGGVRLPHTGKCFVPIWYKTVQEGTRKYKNSTRRYKAVQERYKKVQGGIRTVQEGTRLYKICLERYIPVHTGTN